MNQTELDKVTIGEIRQCFEDTLDMCLRNVTTLFKQGKIGEAQRELENRVIPRVKDLITLNEWASLPTIKFNLNRDRLDETTKLPETEKD